MTNFFKKFLVGLSIVFPLFSMYAEHPFRGAEGPSDYQSDTRLIISDRDNGKTKTRSVELTEIVKFWPENPNWLFGAVSVPCRSLDSGTSYNGGIGDLTLLLGPRAKYEASFGSLYYAVAAGVRLPTGDAKNKPTLGSGNIDYVFNSGLTLLSENKQFSLEAAAVYTFAGSDRDVRSDAFYGGAVFTAKPTKDSSFRFFSGPIATYNFNGKDDRNNRISWRNGVRFTPKSTRRWHIEGWCDNDFFAKNMPKGISGAFVLRYNFGKMK